MRCHQTAGSVPLRHLSLEEPLQDPGQHPTILQVSRHAQGFLSPSNLSFFSRPQRGQSAASSVRFCCPPGLLSPVTNKTVPPGLGSSHLNHIRHILQCSPTLPPETEPVCGAGKVRESLLFPWKKGRAEHPGHLQAVFRALLNLWPSQQSASLSLILLSRRQSKGRVKVGVCDYICSAKTPFCLKKKKKNTSPPTF